MRYWFLVFAALVLFSCNNQSETPAQTNNNTSQASTTPVNNLKVEVAPPKLEPATPADIEVQVEGLQGGTAYLIGVFADQQFGVDSATVDATGKMNFKSKEPYKRGLVFCLLPNQANFQMLIDGDQKFKMKTSLANLVGAMEVTGSVDNELLYENLKYQTRLQPQFNQIQAKMSGLNESSPEYLQLKLEQDNLVAQRKSQMTDAFKKHPNAFYTAFKTAGQNPDLRDFRNADGSVDQNRQVYIYRKEFWQNVNFADERLIYTPVIVNKLKKYMTELTPQHPDSIIQSAKYLVDQTLNYPEFYKFFANWIALNYEPTKTSLMDPEAVHVFMIQNYFTNERAFWSDSLEVYALQKRAGEMAGSLIGNDALDVVANDINGQQQSMLDTDADYIVVFMFNPTCEHCQEEAPQLIDFAKQNPNVDVFTIAVDTDDASWKNFVKKENLPGTHVYDPTNRAIYGKYYVDITPEIYVINKERKIIAKNLKVKQIAEVIQSDKDK